MLWVPLHVNVTSYLKIGVNEISAPLFTLYHQIRQSHLNPRKVGLDGEVNKPLP
jgi:hypothetical protein